jgi:hypothetical protein
VFVAGDFLNREAVVRALADLKANGFTSTEIAVFSDEPLDLPQSVLHRPSHMSFAVVTGAIVSCLLVIGFVYFTQYNYPVVTGGMPIFSFWATGVIFYELTMFGAIVTTFFWFFRESGLLRRRRRRAPAPAIEPGIISVRIQCEGEREKAARRSLESAGAGNVRPLGDAR